MQVHAACAGERSAQGRVQARAKADANVDGDVRRGCAQGCVCGGVVGKDVRAGVHTWRQCLRYTFVTYA